VHLQTCIPSDTYFLRLIAYCILYDIATRSRIYHFFLLLLDILVCNIVIIKVLRDHYVLHQLVEQLQLAFYVHAPASCPNHRQEARRHMQHKQERVGQEAAAYY
jgi:hypothetical protein